MNVVAIVANLQKECDYYKEQCKEYAAVVKQLTEGVKPGEVEYIHPLDMCEILNEPSACHEFMDIFKNKDGLSDIIEIARTGKKYKQSVCIPARTKNFE